MSLTQRCKCFLNTCIDCTGSESECYYCNSLRAQVDPLCQNGILEMQVVTQLWACTVNDHNATRATNQPVDTHSVQGGTSLLLISPLNSSALPTTLTCLGPRPWICHALTVASLTLELLTHSAPEFPTLSCCVDCCWLVWNFGFLVQYSVTLYSSTKW